MGLFGSSKNTTLLQGFYKSAFENKKLDELCALEAGASTSDILRDSDFYILSQNHNNKPLSKLSSFVYSYTCYLPGRMVWLSGVVEGDRLLQFFDKGALDDVNDENAGEAINSIFNKICEHPDLLFPAFDPSIIYYKKIDILRFLHQDDGSTIQIRIGDFQYKLAYLVGKTHRIENCRYSLFDRDDLRFLQLQISEANLRG